MSAVEQRIGKAHERRNAKTAFGTDLEVTVGGDDVANDPCSVGADAEGDEAGRGR